MVVLNCLHVPNILMVGFFFSCSHHKNAVCPWKGPSPLTCHFPGVLYHSDGTLRSAENILSWHASRLCRVELFVCIYVMHLVFSQKLNKVLPFN